MDGPDFDIDWTLAETCRCCTAFVSRQDQDNSLKSPEVFVCDIDEEGTTVFLLVLSAYGRLDNLFWSLHPLGRLSSAQR